MTVESGSTRSAELTGDVFKNPFKLLSLARDVLGKVIESEKGRAYHEQRNLDPIGGRH